jgi:VWFA-related protein
MESRPGAERAYRTGIHLAAFLTASPGVPQEPLARVNVDLVQVELVVTDSKGNRVTNLEAEEMQVSENGQPRRITHFSFIPEASREARPYAAVAPSMRGPVPPPAAAVKPITPPETGRVMAIVVDDLGMDHESFAAVRRSLEGLLERRSSLVISQH